MEFNINKNTINKICDKPVLYEFQDLDGTEYTFHLIRTKDTLKQWLITQDIDGDEVVIADDVISDFIVFESFDDAIRLMKRAGHEVTASRPQNTTEGIA